MVASNPLFLRDAELDRAIELLFFAERDLHARVAGTLERLGLSSTDHRLLYVIARRPGVTPAAAARLVGVSRQAVSRQLQRLTELGWIIRETTPDDRRKLKLRLSPTAQGLVEEIAAVQRRQLRIAFKSAGTEAVAGFGRVLARLAEEPGRRPFQREAA